MRRSRSCVSLKLASTQISLSERIAIRALPDLNIIAGIDIAAGDDAVDFSDDVAIAKVEFSLSEIALGGFEVGFGLLDGRRLRRQLRERAVDIAFGIGLFELLQHLLRSLVVGMDNAQLSRALNQLRLRLQDRGKRLIEIGRHLVEIPAVFGLRPAGPRRHGFGCVRQRLGRRPPGRRQRCLPLVILELAARRLRCDQLRRRSNSCCASVRSALPFECGDPGMQQGDLVSTSSMACCNRQRRLLACASMPRTVALAASRSAFAVSTAAFFTATASEWLLVQFDKKIALAHAIIVIHQNLGNLPWTRAATNVTWPFTKASSVETVLSWCSRRECRSQKAAGQDQNARCQKQHFSPPRVLLLHW